MQSWKTAYILFAATIVVIQTSMPSQGDDRVDSAYELCHNACVEVAHTCLDQITPSLSQWDADRIRTKCGETLDACLAACQNNATVSFQKRHPKGSDH
jgi:hypothetical protein